MRHDEGLHIGYRAWARRETGPSPAIAFGSGLGYTRWQLSEAAVAVTEDGGAQITAQLSNIGARAGKLVVQAFVSRVDPSEVERPSRWLAGFATVRAAAGTATRVSIDISPRAFQHWSVEDHAWIVEPGRYAIRIGTGIDQLGDDLILMLGAS